MIRNNYWLTVWTDKQLKLSEAAYVSNLSKLALLRFDIFFFVLNLFINLINYC